MSYIITLPVFEDTRGKLGVIEKNLPFEIKRVYFISSVPSKDIERGGHRHHKTIQALVAINGSCKIYSDNGVKETTFNLDSPSQCLILEPEDWHKMYEFKNDCVLLVLASELYDIDDYIDTPYR